MALGKENLKKIKNLCRGPWIWALGKGPNPKSASGLAQNPRPHFIRPAAPPPRRPTSAPPLRAAPAPPRRRCPTDAAPPPQSRPGGRPCLPSPSRSSKGSSAAPAGPPAAPRAGLLAPARRPSRAARHATTAAADADANADRRSAATTRGYYCLRPPLHPLLFVSAQSSDGQAARRRRERGRGVACRQQPPDRAGLLSSFCSPFWSAPGARRGGEVHAEERPERL